MSLATTTGTIATPKLVLAAGIWSAELLRPLGWRMPLVAERGYHLEFADPGVSVRNSLMDVTGKAVISSMTDGVRIAGTAEFAAVDAPPNFARAHALAPLAKRVLPGLNLAEARPWMGIRPSFPDSLPAIGPLPRPAESHCRLPATATTAWGWRRPPDDWWPKRCWTSRATRRCQT